MRTSVPALAFSVTGGGWKACLCCGLPQALLQALVCSRASLASGAPGAGAEAKAGGAAVGENSVIAGRGCSVLGGSPGAAKPSGGLAQADNS